jgi:hypothetical protein
MRRTFTFLLLVVLISSLSSCQVWNKLFKPKYGCPSNGKNVGAEKIISGDPEAMKALKKAKKFKS